MVKTRTASRDSIDDQVQGVVTIDPSTGVLSLDAAAIAAIQALPRAAGQEGVVKWFL